MQKYWYAFGDESPQSVVTDKLSQHRFDFEPFVINLYQAEHEDNNENDVSFSVWDIDPIKHPKEKPIYQGTISYEMVKSYAVYGKFGEINE